MSKIFFNNADCNYSLSEKKRIKTLVSNIFLFENKALERIDYIFCSDDYLLDINKRFLQHDYFTDIITFPLSENGQPIVAEIYISRDRIKENALEHKTSIFNETLRVLFHGALHLCGYADKTTNQKLLMRDKENFYINMFHVKQ